MFSCLLGLLRSNEVRLNVLQLHCKLSQKEKFFCPLVQHSCVKRTTATVELCQVFFFFESYLRPYVKMVEISRNFVQIYSLSQCWVTISIFFHAKWFFVVLLCVCVISSGLGTEDQNKLKLKFFLLFSVNCLLRLLISPHCYPLILLS